MISCRQQSQIVVGGAVCPDWTQLVVDPGSPTLITNSGPASFTPGAGSLQTFQAEATALFIGIGISAALCDGTLAGYNGPSCNCNLKLTWTKTGTNFSGIFDVAQVIIQAGATTVTANFNGTTPNGVYNFPFTVPDGTGTPYNITITINVEATVFLGMLSDVTLNLAGVLTNV